MIDSAPTAIEFVNVTYRTSGDRTLISDLNLSIHRGETLMLLGRSGSGKTTTLKLINRLLDQSQGQVLVDGRSTTEWDVIRLRRHIGYAIQEAGLFPHYTVEENVALVPRLERWDAVRTAARVREVLQLVGLPYDEYADRYPSQLSGGQRQRVGLARALAADPKVMLMDEPFGALDPITRDRLQNEFLRLHEVQCMTVIFVTHDIDEAIKLGDRIAILREGGVLAQYDTPDAILAAPADEFVAKFVGADRGLKRLALRRLGEIELESPNGFPADAPRTSLQTTLRDALSLMLTEGAERLVVVDDEGGVLGVLSVGRVSRLLAE